MHTRLPRALAFLIPIALALTTVHAPAYAEDDAGLSQMQDVARVKAEKGLELFAKKQWADAYDNFRVAEELFHAPTLVMYMGHCKYELGELIAARAQYQLVADEALATEEVPEAFANAVETSKQRLEELKARIPSVELHVIGVDPSVARVSLDGRGVELAPATTEVDPGPHQIDAAAPGANPVVLRVDVAEGGVRRVDIELEVVKSDTPPPPPPPPATKEEPGSLVPGFIGLGVGAAGLIVGGVTGAMTLSEVSDIESQCDDNICPAELEQQRDDARPIATVSTIGFIVGAVGVAAGVTLLIIRPGGGPAAAEVGVTPNGLQLRGTF